MITSSRQHISRWLTGAFVAIAVWFAGLVVLTIVAEPTRAVVVFAPDRERVLHAIARSDVTLLDGSERMLNVAGSSPGFVARLYVAGAWLVLPARATGCITPPPPAQVRSQLRD
jgi:hypothetical protein